MESTSEVAIKECKKVELASNESGDGLVITGSECIPDKEKEQYLKIHLPLEKGNSTEQVVSCYLKEGFAKAYDEYYAGTEYDSNEYIAEQLEALTDNKDLKILNVAAGMLLKKGFRNIDALDPSNDMLEVARKKGFYNQMYIEALGNERTAIKEGWVIIMTREAYLHAVNEYKERLEPFMRELENAWK